MTDHRPLIDYLDPAAAASRFTDQGASLGAAEYAAVRNLGYVFAPAEIYPLAPHTRPPLSRIEAFAVDMDGTSTTTEPLALHGLEEMVRRFTGLRTKAAWPGLDEHADYPHVIGNSNFRHTEFLLQRYGDRLDPAAFASAFIETIVWTLATVPDPGRIRDVRLNARNCGLGDLVEDPRFRQAVGGGPMDEAAAARAAAPFVADWGHRFRPHNESERVAAALDLYYARYHAILGQLQKGRGDALAQELLGAGRRLVEPMPGYGIFLCLIKGWLGDEAERLHELLAAKRHAPPENATPTDATAPRSRLREIGARFAEQPARLALVTASIAYETQAVMREIIRLVRAEAAAWPVSAEVRERIDAGLEDYRAVFEGFVTATDAHEARLKPHRDLYTIALYQMAVPRRAYPFCVGIEDTEPGIVSLRAAGFGTAIALPNRDTRGQDYRAATRVVRGGLPELLLDHALFLGIPLPSR